VCTAREGMVGWFFLRLMCGMAGILGCSHGERPAIADNPGDAAGPPLQPTGYQDGIGLSDAVDTNPDPNIVEISLEASPNSLEIVPGTKTEVLTFNGMLPGPVIRTKVGDRLIVHFKNGLKEPTTMVTARVGDTDIWTIDNETSWDHPFHLHGFFFEPIDVAGQVVHEWKDTFNVSTKTTRKIIVHYDDRPGDWMYHCHILEHAETGLMSMLMLR
jgi:FtsP/CotA-like multicopper oxidase with cupredoxin domain